MAKSLAQIKEAIAAVTNITGIPEDPRSDSGEFALQELKQRLVTEGQALEQDPLPAYLRQEVNKRLKGQI